MCPIIHLEWLSNQEPLLRQKKSFTFPYHALFQVVLDCYEKKKKKKKGVFDDTSKLPFKCLQS